MNEEVPRALTSWAKDKGLTSHRWLELLTPTKWDRDQDVVTAYGETLSFVNEESDLYYYAGECQAPERASMCFWCAISRQMMDDLPSVFADKAITLS